MAGGFSSHKPTTPWVRVVAGVRIAVQTRTAGASEKWLCIFRDLYNQVHIFGRPAAAITLASLCLSTCRT